MKELSIGQKPEAYDKAINKAKSKINNDKDHVLYEDDIIEIFPELKESDERMLAMAIKAVHAPEAQNCIKSWGINPNDVIAWLENQSDKRSTKWTEEDEEMIIAIKQLIDDNRRINSWNCVYIPNNDKEIFFDNIVNWINSLKERI